MAFLSAKEKQDVPEKYGWIVLRSIDESATKKEQPKEKRQASIECVSINSFSMSCRLIRPGYWFLGCWRRML
jgi:hypothetical protein